MILQKETPIGPDDTLGSVYFDRLFPLGVEALKEAADLVVGGRATATVQDESQASYEGWCRIPKPRSTGTITSTSSMTWCAAAILRRGPGLH